MTSAISGLGDYYSQYNKTDATTGKLENNLTSTDYATASADELMEACKEFESYFVEQVIKSMEKMIPKDEDEENTSSTSYLENFSDLLTQEMAQTATDKSDFGIAQMLYEQMKRNYGITEE